MPPISVLLLQPGPAHSGNITRTIEKQFLNVVWVNASSELGAAIARVRAPLAIVDLELIKFEEVARLCAEFPATAIVCAHRLADDSMWSQSLASGAVDCCLTSDVLKILQASDRYVAIKESRASTAA